MTPEESNAHESSPADGYIFTELLFRCMTPLHVGCGQDVGVVDLPVIRERTTGYPFIPGSGIRGAFRDICERRDDILTRRLLGSADSEQAGCVIVGDARLLLFPVRSHPGVFRWITCPFVLSRYAQDTDYFLGGRPALGQLPSPADDTYAGPEPRSNPLMLEEFPFASGPAWTSPVVVEGVDANRVVLVHDEVFAYFVRNATIVTQHNHLSAAKTVLQGQLFSVEAVPPEAVFYGFVGSTAERAEEAILDANGTGTHLRELLTAGASPRLSALILGGHEGTGLGLTRVIWK